MNIKSNTFLMGLVCGMTLLMILGADVAFRNLSMINGVCTQAIQFFNIDNWFYGHGSPLVFSVPSASGNVARLDAAGRLYDGGAGGSTATGDVTAPATTTQGKIPQWDSTQKKLTDGLLAGTSAGNLVQLDGSAKLPAVDGSQLTNLPASAITHSALMTANVNVQNYGDDFVLDEALNGYIISNYGAVKNLKCTMVGGLSANWSCTILNQVGGNPVGGTVTADGANTVVTFTSSGTLVVNKNMTVKALVVGGGGSAGYGASSCGSGGGGGGGVQYSASLSLTPGTYTVTVGGGGARKTGDGTGNNGESSVFATLTAGGGLGGVSWASGGQGGVSGTPQSNAGGSTKTNYGGCGGGGAGATGASSSNGNGGNGGAGYNSTISGASKYYGAGGGGACGSTSTPGTGDPLGGGHGGGNSGQFAQTAGTANYGSGGGGVYGPASGGDANPVAPNGGMEGGSGVVIISYVTSGNSSISIAPPSGGQLPGNVDS